jgi:hypothetical protein
MYPAKGHTKQLIYILLIFQRQCVFIAAFKCDKPGEDNRQFYQWPPLQPVEWPGPVRTFLV